MPAKPLPPFVELNRLFRADFIHGRLFWQAGAGGGFAGKEAAPCVANPKMRRRVCINGEMHAVSRVLWAMFTGNDPGDKVVDHIDGDCSNNCVTNLRLATVGENNVNRKAYGQTGIRGVYPRRSADGSLRYIVQIRRNQRTHYYGTFYTIEEAAEKAAAAHRVLDTSGFLPCFN